MSKEANEIYDRLPAVRLIIGAEETKVMAVIPVALDTCCADNAVICPDTWRKLGSPDLVGKTSIKSINGGIVESPYFLGTFGFGQQMFRNVPVVVHDRLPPGLNILGWPLLKRVRFSMDLGKPTLLKNTPATHDFSLMSDDDDRE